MIEVRKGTGIGQLLPVVSIGITSGARYGDLMAGATISPYLDSTSGYAWSGAAATLGDFLARIGSIRPGETGQSTMMKILTGMTGEWDTTTTAGYTVWRMDGVEVFRLPLPTSTGRAQATDN